MTMGAMTERNGWLVSLGLRKALEWAEESTDLEQLIDKIKEALEEY